MSQTWHRHRLSQFSVGALALGLCFYHVREVLVCWLIFSLLFFGVTLLILGGILVCHACNMATHWMRKVMPGTPVFALNPVKSTLETSRSTEPLANE